jgi:hypothetical protein
MMSDEPTKQKERKKLLIRGFPGLEKEKMLSIISNLNSDFSQE